jgi:hypothetical protein
MILGYPRPKYFFFWSTKSFASKNQIAPDFLFSLESVTFGKVTYGETPQGMGSDWKNLPGTAHTHSCFNI